MLLSLRRTEVPLPSKQIAHEKDEKKNKEVRQKNGEFTGQALPKTQKESDEIVRFLLISVSVL
jgi:hypothetical protein